MLLWGVANQAGISPEVVGILTSAITPSHSNQPRNACLWSAYAR
jgi:hypothetical protein